MQTSAFTQFICPMDQLPLSLVDASLRCQMGHSFDRASEGYYNLLLVQQKASLAPGDNKEMVAARRRFLTLGHYKPIAQKLFSATQKIIETQNKQSINIVDAGCGEGYYLEQLQEQARNSAQAIELRLAGFDISKFAVRVAAKQNPNIAWAVASNRQPPFAEGSIDFLLCLFGFPAWTAFAKILKNDGYIILVDPAEDHLLELRKIIYPQVNKTKASSIDAALDYFELKSKERVQFKINVEGQGAIQDLLAMTPHAYRISTEGSIALNKMQQLTLTVDLVFRVLKKA